MFLIYYLEIAYIRATLKIFKSEGRFDSSSLSDVKKIIKKQAKVHYLRGVKHFLNEELKDAIKEWEKTLALEPEYKKAEKYIQNAKNLLEKLKKVK